MSNRGIDRFNETIIARARTGKGFEVCEEYPEYESLADVRTGKEIKAQLSEAALELAARQLGPSFVYNLYVNPLRLFHARNLIFKIMAKVMKNPFAPYVNIINCPALDEGGEWILEANGRLVGSPSL
jgi:hypothetical protein